MKQNSEDRIGKIAFGTLFYGVLINLTILVLIDNGYDCNRSFEDAFCSPYPFYLILSLFVGWIISIIISKKENKK